MQSGLGWDERTHKDHHTLKRKREVIKAVLKVLAWNEWLKESAKEWKLMSRRTNEMRGKKNSYQIKFQACIHHILELLFSLPENLLVVYVLFHTLAQYCMKTAISEWARIPEAASVPSQVGSRSKLVSVCQHHDSHVTSFRIHVQKIEDIRAK